MSEHEVGSGMNRAYVEVAPDALAALLRKTGRVFKVISGLPGDARLVEVENDFSGTLKCLFQSASFGAVGENDPWPRVGPVEFRTYEAGLTSEDREYLEELVAIFDLEPHKTLLKLSDTLARQILARLRKILEREGA